MATYTVLISVPDSEAPGLASDLAEFLKGFLESGGGLGYPIYTVATVDAMRGDHLKNSVWASKVRDTHRHVAGSNREKPQTLDALLAPLEAEALRSGRHLSEI